ncbi:MAG: hypothetical protein EA394_00270 [Bacteroidia bacterium]|nr:MAG: hypothetical protein EA394_00270 [Bacteroidia bacterium]
MKVLPKLAFIFLYLLPSATMAGNFPAGARSAGMANASVAIYDFWGISHNQAGMAHIQYTTAAVYTENRFLLPEMSLTALAVIMPASYGNLGFSVKHFGFDLYREGKAGIAYSRTFGKRLSAGMQISYLFLAIGEGYGRTGTVAGEIGMIYEVREGIFAGAHLFNPNSSLRTKHEYLDMDERYPAIFRLGLSVAFADNLTMSVEAEKDIRHPMQPKFGLEYGPGNNIYLRAGISIIPMENTFGFGITIGQWQLDIASSYDFVLGYSPQAGLIYTFK